MVKYTKIIQVIIMALIFSACSSAVSGIEPSPTSRGGKTVDLPLVTPVVKLVSTPTNTRQASAPGLGWRLEQSDVCQTLAITDLALSFGNCAGAMKEALLSEGRKKELAEMAATYQSFSNQTASGKIDFTGMGKATATASEQRSLAEWARLVFQEAESGRSGAAWGLVFSWHREGGIAGFCDDLGVYASGWAYYSSCKIGSAANAATFRLSAQELEHLYTWADELGNFELDQNDPATADAMQTTMIFNGWGTKKASSAVQEEILNFAQTLNGERLK